MDQVIRRELSDMDVLEIRVRYAGGERQGALAREYGTTQAHVSKIVRGEARRRAGGPIRVITWGVC